MVQTVELLANTASALVKDKPRCIPRVVTNTLQYNLMVQISMWVEATGLLDLDPVELLLPKPTQSGKGDKCRYLPLDTIMLSRG